MHTPTLSELPPPPHGKSGWPWTEASAHLPEKRLDNTNWPKISVVTPSFNQGHFIEETIRSVLLQGYSNMEFVIIDGGSTDDSVEIIKKYEPWLSYWESNPDRGQSHAINKGFAQCDGEIYTWINSDDVYFENAFSNMGANWRVGQTNMLAGNVIKGSSLNAEDCYFFERGQLDGFVSLAAYWLPMYNSRIFVQPEVFFSKSAWLRSAGLSENLWSSMDTHLWAKFAAYGIKPEYIEDTVVLFRKHSDQKTDTNNRIFKNIKSAERAWILFDALRIAKKSGDADISQEEFSLLNNYIEKNAGGYVRIIDVLYRYGNRFYFLISLLYNALVRPNSTIRYRARGIIAYFAKKHLN